jgi:enoyl-[acyl-carrier protein] reductase II
MANKICAALGVRYPIILGGLAGIGDAQLAAAVSNAGGLGLMGAGPWPGPQLREQIRAARDLTDEIFGVNIPLQSGHAEELVETVIAEGIRVVSTSAGNPRLYTSRLKENGVFVIQVVPTVTHAMSAVRAGVDAIVAEGAESGGRISAELISTLVLVPQVVDAVDCPVIAAGGIGDGRAMAAAMALGAAGVQLGTAFLASEECVISRATKEMLIMARETDTRVTISGKGGSRSLKGELLERARAAIGKRGEDALDDDPGERLVNIGAGQVAGLIRSVRPVREIIEEMVTEARAALPWLDENLPEPGIA